ncbi:MAG: alpha/beta hydrolase, partial [Gemmatimonadaceae bacterium]|nr:alpha/beta hydrolase [Gemmatimonadaceae bacterium]
TLVTPHGPLAYADLGPRDGLPVMLLHGFPHDRGVWRAQREALPEALAGIRLILPDLPGFGGSAPLPEPSVDTYADAVIAVLDHAGVATAVVGGLSMGGYVAFAAWRRHASRISALALFDTRAGADGEAAREKRRAVIALAQAEGAGAVAEQQLPGQLGRTTRSEAPALVEEVEIMLRRASVQGIVDGQQLMLARPDSTPSLPLITVPTLVVVGDEDVLTPPDEARSMAAQIAGARLVVVAGAGHLAPLEQGATVNAALAEFLSVRR